MPVQTNIRILFHIPENPHQENEFSLLKINFNVNKKNLYVLLKNIKGLKKRNY